MSNLDSRIDSYIKLALQKDRAKYASYNVEVEEEIPEETETNNDEKEKLQVREALNNSTIFESDKEFWQGYYNNNIKLIKESYKVSSFNEYYGIIKSASNLTKARNLRKFQATPIKRFFECTKELI